MKSSNNKLYENHQSNCTKYKDYNSRIQQLEQDVTEKEDEAMFWYRQYEDAKEEQSIDSVKTRKIQHRRLKEVKKHE
ncbi:MAG TPA: hypothetical protein VH796_08785 [Nitrososphaeraceae archaeon]|jgi:hypothetical protein